jgi:hypothetical protein
MTLDGAAERTEILLAGSGSYRADGLQSKDVKIQIMGSGSAVLAASEKLDATLVGSGSVEYVGNAVVSTQTIGSGSVRKR